MAWTAYQVILRLHSPMHIGWGKASYLQRTRPYVTGSVLRGALVSRIARNQNQIGQPDDPYRRVSKTLAQFLTFSYFYPALKVGETWKAQFPWKNEEGFRRRFLSSYTGTALSYPQQSAAEGLLHEVEFISPYTLDTGEPVYLMGYVFVEEQRCRLPWQAAFRRLQLGGERGYGWGEARLEKEQDIIRLGDSNIQLFNCKVAFNGLSQRPVLHLSQNECLLAHATVNALEVVGEIEPVVGREWRKPGLVGQHLAFNDVFFAPGSVVRAPADFAIAKAGYWRLQTEQTVENATR